MRKKEIIIRVEKYLLYQLINNVRMEFMLKKNAKKYLLSYLNFFFFFFGNKYIKYNFFFFKIYNEFERNIEFKLSY
jgi:hypothetical protein